MIRPPEVDAWINALDTADRHLYDTIEAVILGTGLVDEIAFSYKLPTFTHGKHPVTVSKWKGGISMSVRDAEPIEAFKTKHPDITGGKISLQFRRDGEVPRQDLADLVRAALDPMG